MRTFLLRDLTPGTNYSIQVRSVSQNGVSEWSRKFALTTQSDVTPPVAVSWTDPEANAWRVDGDTFVATWQPIDPNLDQNKDFSRYELVLSDGTKTVTVSTTNTTYVLSYEQNRAFFGTPRATVTARVRSVDQTGNASALNTLLSATNPAPSAITGLVATEQIDAILLNWNANLDPDFQYYLVQVSTSGVGGSYVSVYSGTANSFTHPTTLHGTDHFYRVYAVDKFNTTSPVTTSGAVRPETSFGSDTTPPNNATSFDVTTAFDATRQEALLTASWTDSTSTDASRYIVRYSPTDPTGTPQWRYEQTSGDISSMVLGGLVPNQNYWVQIKTVDFSGNESSWANAATYPRLSAKDVTTVPTPLAPTASVGTMKLQVIHSGLDSTSAAMPLDIDFYEVYASTTNGFTTYNTTTMLGTIQNGPVMSETFNIPASAASGTTQTWYVKVIAVDKWGNKSSASAQATAAVGLIVTANIGDAQITNAKINDLQVNKLTGGTIETTDITIKSRLILGEQGNDGVIESFNYTAGGNVGFSLDSDGLVIKSGVIEAAALKIQTGVNIGAPGFCDFEYTPAFYPTSAQFVDSATGVTANVLSEQAKFGSRSLKVINTSGAGRSAYLSVAPTTYNVRLEATTTYIISAYVYNGDTGLTPNLQMGLKFQDATEALGTAVALPGAVGWSRFTWVVTSPAGAVSGIVVFRLSGNGTAYLDGVQVETKIANSTTPSPWTPPAMTTINGGGITTGAIQSNQPAYDAEGNVIPDMPAWSINLEGKASFGDAQVRGVMLVGYEGEVNDTFGADDDISIIKSPNYQRGIAGWAIKSNGLAEFRNLEADSISAEAIAAVDPENINAGKISVNGDLIVSNRIKAQSETISDVYNRSRTSNFATLTTPEPHGRNVGDRLYVEVGKSSVMVESWEVSSAGLVTLTTTILGHDYVVGDIIRAELTDALGQELEIERSTITAITATTISFSYPSLSETASTPIMGNIYHIDVSFSSANLNDLFTITGVTETTLTYANTGSDVALTFSSGHVRAYGRSVQMSPEGLILLASDGVTPLVNLPTASSAPATFSGAITADSLSVADNFILSGENNQLNPEAALVMGTKVVAPKAQTSVAFTRDGYSTFMTGTSGRDNRGMVWDGTNYHTVNIGSNTRTELGNVYWTVMDAFGKHVTTYKILGNIMTTAGGIHTIISVPYGGITKVGTTWCVLRWLEDVSTVSNIRRWEVVRYSDDGPSGGPGTLLGTWQFNEWAAWGVTSNQWWQAAAGGGGAVMQDPCIGTDGTNVYIARTTPTGSLKWGIFSVLGVKSSVVTATGITINDTIAYIEKGQFDYGVDRVIVANRGWPGMPTPKVYLFNTSGANQSGETFSVEYNRPSKGFAYRSSSTTFVQLNQDHNLYFYPGNAKTGGTSWAVKSTWEDGYTSSHNITQRSRSGNVATLTLASGHGFVAGDTIVVAGVSDATFNGTFVITVSTSTSVSYDNTGTTVATTASGGTITSVAHETDYNASRSFTAIRRAPVRLDVAGLPIGYSGRDKPDRARHYVSTNGGSTYIRMPKHALVGSTYLSVYETPTTSDGVKAQNFPTRTPAKIVSPTGDLEITADGAIKGTSLTLGGAPTGKASIFTSTSTQSVANATWTGVTSWALSGIGNNIYGGISSSTLTITHDGTYIINAQAQFASNGTGRRLIGIWINGVDSGIQMDTAAATFWMGRISAVIPLSIGDTVQVMVWQGSGAALALQGGHKLELCRLGPK